MSGANVSPIGRNNQEWLVQATDYRKLNEPPRPRLQRNGTIYLMARPPLLCQGGDFAFPAGCPRRPCPADDLWVRISKKRHKLGRSEWRITPAANERRKACLSEWASRCWWSQFWLTAFWPNNRRSRRSRSISRREAAHHGRCLLRRREAITRSTVWM